MTTTLQQYTEAREPLDAIVAAVPADRWSRPSPCDGWTARDVLGHLIETQRDFFTVRRLDLGAAPDLDVDRASAWREHAQRVVDILGDDAVVAAEYDGYFGPTTLGETFTQFYVWDMLVHRWDIATAAGLDAKLIESELDDIDQGADAFGEGLYTEGICKPGVEADPESDRLTKVLAKLGRRGA